ncbi:hypothetical protein GCM10010193_22910 [Kitasatospora atroaurantiaca]|uniref:Putative peptidoglycan binding protein n=1 Tax=Kitasatospora atroaurantiaca TaxID=285545 RepID=A0A561EUP0_9ACTN|nr:peptidoglycan binding domain-containing protein [Kitasatospora atroaurantiaca]TWE19318.1 putative peptidoglycan binding protein [Kitasatospora atroaurantiaca]
MSSRESDSAYPPPRRKGPDAYPSGTPPYGTGVPNGFGADPFGPAGQPAAAQPGAADGDDVPKTETTLTTRVRINIPGSRPIPPVVVRSTVKNEDAPAAPAEPSGPRHRSGASSSPVLGVVDAGSQSSTPPNLPPEWQEGKQPEGGSSEGTGEWFRPRQKTGSGPAPVPAGAGAPRTAAAAQPAPTSRPAQEQPAQERPAQNRQASAPRPSGAPASPFAAGRQPGTAEDPFAGNPGAGRRPGFGAGPSGPGPGGPSGDPFAADPFATSGPGAADPFAAPSGAGDPFRPAGGGAARRQPGPRQPQPPQVAGEPEDTQIGGFDPVGDDFPPAAIPGGPPNGNLFGSAPPAASGADPFAPNRPGAAQDPFAAAQPGPGRFADGPYEAAAPLREPTPPGTVRPGHVRPDPENEILDPEEKPAKARKKGRGSKLAVYAVGGLLFAGAAAYGTGLMLNQADIPKGTTVLGTDIGGDTRDQAVSALDGSVGKAGQQPVKLKIGEQTVDLDPATAGLSFDTTATVDALTKHSYNPVEVIGSLAGGSKAVAPEVKVDRAKLKAALDALGAKSGQGLQEGFVRFTADGKTEVVPGKAGQAVDTAAAVDQVEQAYRSRAAGEQDAVLTLPVTAAQPKISEDALKAAADELGKQVLNGSVMVWAGTKKFEFGKVTASKVLTLVPDDSGKVVLKWDLDKLNDALNGVFDKSKFKKNGAQVAITPQDVADGIASVLDKTGTKDRVFKFS